MVVHTVMYGNHLTSVHHRELAAPAEPVGALLDGLGGAGDRLWPADLWPTTPFELDGPLAPGTRGRQGQLRQTVEAYDPGRRIVLRFDPAIGLEGTHRFEVAPLGERRARLTHTLDCRVRPKLLPVLPILRRQHDALVEDLFDRAELAVTGRVASPARWPASVRVANGVEEHGARVAALLVPAALTAIAALHAAWALGSSWPAADEQALAEAVFSASERDAGLPPAAATWAVAGALLAAAGIVRSAGTGTRSRTVRRAAWAVSGVFLARGVVFVPSDVLGGLRETYQRYDLALYSPLCLALGAGAALAAASPAAER